MTEFGLALGGGGVKGLAHIALLKKLDALQLKPSAIAGTSIGAIIGALYASGLSGADIEARVRGHLFSRSENLKQHYQRRKKLVKWMKVFSFSRARGGLLSADGLFEHLFSEIVDISFDELPTPFTAVATDLKSGDEVPLKSGPLLAAVQASMSVPGIFAPVEVRGRQLVDGGLVNNVPCSHVAAVNRKILASDVICLANVDEPKTTQVVSSALSIMLRSATLQQFKLCAPDYVFRPDTRKIDAFDFHKITTVLERGDEAIKAADQEISAFFGVA